MFASIRVYRGVRSTEKVVRRAKKGFVPILKQSPGFRGWYIVDGGDGKLATFSLFDSEEDAIRSSGLAEDWIRENHFTELLPEPPDVTAGEVRRSVSLPSGLR